MAYCNSYINLDPKNVKYDPACDEAALKIFRQIRKVLELPKGLTKSQREEWFRTQDEIDVKNYKAFFENNKSSYEEQLRTLINIEKQRIDKSEKSPNKLERKNCEEEREL